MPPEELPQKFKFSKTFKITVGVVVAAVLGVFFFELFPANSAQTNQTVIEVKPGDNFIGVAGELASEGIVRSRLAFGIWSILDGAAPTLRPGLYRLSPAMSSFQISDALIAGNKDITVTIPEGWNIFQIDKALSDALVIKRGDLIAGGAGLEGKLFPDTYQFRNDEPVAEVIKTMTDNFDKKAGPLFGGTPATREKQILIVASILEKEAKTSTDQRMIAGIIQRRITTGIMLDIDATVCYAKQIALPGTVVDCAGLVQADFHSNSPYNTYAHYGLPPASIGNPGLASITAAQNPTPSAYLYYLSDPATGNIIYAKTLQEQSANIKKYLK